MMELTVNTEPLGLPIPVPWLLGIKLLGFLLHMIFMNLWLAGMPVALFLIRSKPLVADRLFKAMPFFMAFGINAGIVPLLFLQTLYPQFFYPATILQGWFWLLVIPLLIVAYYAVYFAAFGRYRAVAASIASVLLTWIGLTFSAAISLTATPEYWPAIYAASAEAGSVHGFFVNLSLESVARFLLMFGMSLGTLAAFLALDSESRSWALQYKSETRQLVAVLYVIGFCLFGIVGVLYGPTVKDRLPALLWLATAASMPLGVLSSLAYRWRPSRRNALVLVSVQLLVLLLNGLTRQIVQTQKLAVWSNLQDLPVRGDWDSFFLFIIVLGMVLAAMLWLGRIVCRTSRGSAGARNPGRHP